MPDESSCQLFGGVSGKVVVLTLTGGAFVTYVGSFAAKKRYGLDRRTWEIFWLDLTKMGLGQFFALLINVLNAHRNSSSEYDPVSWYLPTFLNDEIIAVPLGVLLWHQCLLRLAAAARRRWYPRSVFLQALQASCDLATITLQPARNLFMQDDVVFQPVNSALQLFTVVIGKHERRLENVQQRLVREIFLDGFQPAFDYGCGAGGGKRPAAAIQQFDAGTFQ